MAHTEADMRRSVKLLVELYGELNTSELIEHISEVIDLDDEDLALSNSRTNEPKFQQTIRNIGSHQGSQKIKYYDEGFYLEKVDSRNSIYKAIVGIGNKVKPISSSQSKNRKLKARKSLKRRRLYKNTNRKIRDERIKFVGAKGEDFVYQYEIDKVKSFSKKSISRVIHLSLEQGDGAGYDITSIDNKGNSIFIEVKTTESDVDTPFYLSENERSFFEENIKSKYVFLYRVYNFNPESCTGNILIITPKQLFEKYNIDPITYRVTLK